MAVTLANGGADSRSYRSDQAALFRDTQFAPGDALIKRRVKKANQFLS